MEATQTDVEYPQLTSQEDGTVDSIAGGIMDLLDDPDPNASGTVEPKPAETSATEPEPETTEPADEPEKFIIKRQGQEVEVTQQELINLAQQGYDYTQKTQALAQERDNLAPIQGLATLLKSDPAKAAQIAAILSGQAPQAQPEKKTFDDPIEQLKWDTKQEIMAEVRREQQAAMVPLHRQAALNQVKAQVQADPDFKEVHQAIIDMVKGQPPTIQKALFLQLDQDPAAYVEAFQHFKNQKATKPTTTTPPKPTKTTTHARFSNQAGWRPRKESKERRKPNGSPNRRRKPSAAAIRAR
jgi:hypothetical protein